MMEERAAPMLSLEREATRDYALTARQSLFWLDGQLFPGVPYHHIVLTLTLRGELDGARFFEAYRETVLAFDHLHLVFEVRDGEPRQHFRRPSDVELPLIELNGLSPHDWVAARCVRPFRLAEQAFDGALLRLSEREHVFYFCQHHIISDGTSAGLFVRDLARRYAGESVAERPSYAHYLEHERAYRGSPRAQKAARYFADKLPKNAPLKLYGRPLDDTSVGVERTFLDGGVERWHKLSELARDPAIELFDDSMSRLVALATVLFAFLYRVSGSRTLVVGTPVPNRGPRFVETGGLLMEQAFLRVDIDDGETFRSLAAKVRRELLQALRYGQHCVSDRGLAYTSLNLLRLPDVSLPGLSCELSLAPATALGKGLERLIGDTRERLRVHIVGFEQQERLTIGFDFHRGTFDAALRERAKGHFFAMFDAMANDLDAALDVIRLTSEEERRALLALGSGPEPAAPQDLTERLSALARERSDTTALVFAGERLSYGQLVERIGQLAHLLQRHGVRAGDRVGVCLERGFDEPIAMLAALWRGAAYVPLDPTHPRERLAMVAEDAKLTVLVTSRAHVGLVPFARAHTLVLDDERSRLLGLEPLAPVLSAPDALAYVLFTSGSTGRPKGVEIPRGALHNFLASMARTPGMTSDDRLLAITTTSFDIAALELFLPLWVGASVHIADRDAARDPDTLRALLEREPITVMQATPTTWRLLVEAGYDGRARSLRKLCGGEALSPELAEALLATGGELYNMYGPTETTVWSTVARVATPQRLTIGRPIDHTQVYVLDAAGELVPEGVVGELCIGGRGLARGYVGAPMLTREKFFAPRDRELGERLYRTGDLGRVLPHGDFECLGRRDDQVKVRGVRIELGEIESAMRKVSGVRAAVVAARPDGRGEVRLVAYWIGEASREAIQQALRRSLPSAMQPSAFVQLEAFPLNTNGKVDRKALPMPAETTILTNAPPPMLRSDREARMLALFSEVLGKDVSDPEADFFSLGGDSVAIIQLRRRIQAETGIELPLATMFDWPSPRRLLEALGPRPPQDEPLCIALRRGPKDLPPLVCLMGVALYHPLAYALHTERSVYGLHVPYAPRAHESVQDLAGRYAGLMAERLPPGPYHLAGLCLGGVVAYETARRLLLRGHDVRSLSLFDARLPRAITRKMRARLRSWAHLVTKDPRAALMRAARASERALTPLVRRFGQTLRDDELEHDLLATGPRARAMVLAYDRTVEPLPRPLTLFRATERAEPDWWTLDWDLGWGGLATQVTVHAVPGTHLGILASPQVEYIARELERVMRERDGI